MVMLRRLLPLALAVGLLLAAAPAANAKYRVGLGEQKHQMFDQPEWQELGLKRVRYLVPWDYAEHDRQIGEVGYYMGRARQLNQDVLVTFTAPKGCFEGGRYSRDSDCRAPSARAYRSAFRNFDRQFPWVKTYSAWNEVNHKSQPTYRKPSLAVRYYEVLRKDCRSRDCRVMALDLLDERNMSAYLAEFRSLAKGSPRLWGLHNYGDVNRRRSSYTRELLRTVPGEVWLTETGGIVRFEPNFPHSESRAARRTRDMFRLADRYDSLRSGHRSKITRLFVYKWFGEDRDERFDAGLVEKDGTPRRALETFAEIAENHR
jgi:hypothetical protein